jgi:hypothetical protein
MAMKSRLSILLVATLVLVALGALAQNKTTKPKATDATEEAKNGEDAAAAQEQADPGADDSGDPTEHAVGDDLGDPPPKRKEGDDKVPPSPLTPRPEEFPKGELKPPPADYDKLLSDIAALRGRVAALTTTLFKSKLRVIVQTEGDEARISRFVVTLDDGIVFTAPARFVAEDEKIVYEHAVAPGHHVVGVEVERADARGPEFKTWQTSQFSVVVPDSKLLETQIYLEDDSDMAEDFPEDADGEYELSVRLRARVADE